MNMKLNLSSITTETTIFCVMDTFILKKQTWIERGSCNFTCANRKYCNSSISLKTECIEEKNRVIEPLVIVHIKISHHESCTLLSVSDVEKHQFIRSIKGQVVNQPHRPIQQIYESSVTEHLS
jgi:hypothetical protein